jgi:hypothetical protein
MTHEWLTVADAARHAKCGTRSIYLAVQQQKLQAARLGGRRELRFLEGWVDAWLLASCTPAIVNAAASNDETRRDLVQSPAH